MLIYIILVITGLCEITIKNLIKYSLLSINYYWFAIVYIILVMISPALNCIWEYVIKIKEKRIMLSLFILLCIICFIFSDSFGFYLGINNGYSFAFSSYLYLVGRMIRRHEDLIKRKLDFFKSFIGYLISVLLTSGGVQYCCSIIKEIWRGNYFLIILQQSLLDQFFFLFYF